MKLLSPLFAEGGRSHQQQTPLALPPTLTEDQRSLDGLSQPHFVGQQHAFGQRRAHSEHRRLDLMRIEINAGGGK